MLSAHEEIAFGRRKIWSASLHIPLAECFMATKLPLHIAFGNASFEIACEHERIYFISLDAKASNFIMTASHYFISEGYFIRNEVCLRQQDIAQSLNPSNIPKIRLIILFKFYY